MLDFGSTVWMVLSLFRGIFIYFLCFFLFSKQNVWCQRWVYWASHCIVLLNIPKVKLTQRCDIWMNDLSDLLFFCLLFDGFDLFTLFQAMKNGPFYVSSVCKYGIAKNTCKKERGRRVNQDETFWINKSLRKLFLIHSSHQIVKQL